MMLQMVTSGIIFAHNNIKWETFSGHPVGIQRNPSKVVNALQKTYKTTPA